MVSASREKIQRSGEATSFRDGIRRGLANFRRRQLLDAHSRGRLEFLQIHKDESRRVPDLVRKGAVAGYGVFAQRDIRSRRGFDGQREAQRVGPVLFHPFQRVHHVPAHLGHLLSLRVANQRVQVKRAKGNPLHAAFSRARDAGTA